MALRRVVLLDALGTLVRLDAPAPHLATALGVPLADAVRAVRVEMAFYRRELMAARDRAGLAALRRRCAVLVRDELGLAAAEDEVEAALLASLRFTAFDEVPGALRAWRQAGATLVVVSNWDVSLHDVLEATGLRPLLDAVVTSAELGVAKPDPRPFAHALALIGGGAGDALHVGDDLRNDVEGARAAGIEPLLLVRDGAAPPGVPAVRSLAGAVEHWSR